MTDGAPPRPTRKVTILLADDEPDIRRLLRRTLELDGRFEVVGEAEDGRQALEFTLRDHPNVIVLDLAMPVLDGLTIIPELVEKAPQTKIVVLSAFATGEMSSQALQRGATVYMEKGEAMKELIPAIIAVARDLIQD